MDYNYFEIFHVFYLVGGWWVGGGPVGGPLVDCCWSVVWLMTCRGLVVGGRWSVGRWRICRWSVSFEQPLEKHLTAATTLLRSFLTITSRSRKFMCSPEISIVHFIVKRKKFKN